MPEILIQYMLVVILVLALGYLIYYLKEKGLIRNDDYYGITYTILGVLDGSEASKKNVKAILRAVSSVVQCVEANHKDEESSRKEEKALEMARSAIKALGINSAISDDSIRYLIRLACAFLQPADRT